MAFVLFKSIDIKTSSWDNYAIMFGEEDCMFVWE